MKKQSICMCCVLLLVLVVAGCGGRADSAWTKNEHPADPSADNGSGGEMGSSRSLSTSSGPYGRGPVAGGSPTAITIAEGDPVWRTYISRGNAFAACPPGTVYVAGASTGGSKTKGTTTKRRSSAKSGTSGKSGATSTAKKSGSQGAPGVANSAGQKSGSAGAYSGSNSPYAQNLFDDEAECPTGCVPISRLNAPRSSATVPVTSPIPVAPSMPSAPTSSGTAVSVTPSSATPASPAAGMPAPTIATSPVGTPQGTSAGSVPSSSASLALPNLAPNSSGTQAAPSAVAPGASGGVPAFMPGT